MRRKHRRRLAGLKGGKVAISERARLRRERKGAGVTVTEEAGSYNRREVGYVLRRARKMLKACGHTLR